MQTTGNLGLKKPEGTDIVDIADLNGNMDILDTTVNNKVDKVSGKQLSTNDYTAAEKTKLAGIATGATNYTHPATHPPSIIAQDASNRFVTDVEKTAWNGKAPNTLVSAAPQSDGLMRATDKIKLDGIATGANNYVHPANHPATMITEDATHRFATDTEKSNWNGKPNLDTTPQQTTADITYYVSTVGNDSATGLSPGTAFKTIAKAISMIPTVVNHTVTIMVTAGTYTGDIYVAGFCGQGTVAISGAASAATTHTITGSAIVTRCSCRVTVIGINSTVTTNKAFVAYNANEVLFQYCRTDVSTAQSAFWIDHAKAYVVNCIIVGKTDTAITAYVNSEVLVQDCTGSANRVGHRAAYGGRLQISGSFIGSSIKMETNEGGIVSDSIGVINPWGDNTMYARSVMRASMGSAATIAPNAFSKLAFNVMHQDFSNEFNTTLNRFTAKKTGWYLVSGSVSLGPIAPGNAISLSVFVNGNRESDIGSFSPSGVAGPGTATQGATCLYLPAGAFVELFCYPSVAVTTYFGPAHTHFTVTQIA
ncbi:MULTISPECIES: hypothetical protein [Paenibacillus]|uniref:hypothetical protein n=1 Tax=Paenibacillus TaxID=44249 RepID=UPI00096BD281|nr:hypothetical protein [Paenibacillus odorifer]OMD08165.1 hypothetical protein BJP50_31010 [Paenibacillus odorifer]